jgi:prepilin-type N-terminal cleavage/methylation domain-containing protein
MEDRKQRGQTLTELLVAVAVIGLFMGISASPLEQARKRTALAAGTAELRAVFQQTRIMAITRDRNVALKFRSDADGWAWSVYEDGDGDGVRTDDITRGVDRQLGTAHRFEHAPVRIGLPRLPLPDPYNPGHALDTRSPVRFGTSTICSFTRVGDATNGSLVITDGERTVLLRTYGEGARISVLLWNGKRWTEGE